MMQEQEIGKKSKLLRHIFRAKYALHRLKYYTCIKRNYKYSKAILKEFRRNELLKKIFKLIQWNYNEVVNKRRKQYEYD
jgi:hypothetical protein